MPQQNFDDVSNTALYQLITSKVLPALEEIKLHQVETNGRVSHLEEREESHTEQLQAGRKKHGELDQRLTRVEAVTEVRDQYQEKEIDEAKGERRGIQQELIQVGKEIARIGAGAGLAALVIKLLGEVRP